MATDEAKRASRSRGQLIEPVFGILKEQMGLRRFSLRGVVNVAAEWTVSATRQRLPYAPRIMRTNSDFTNKALACINYLEVYGLEVGLLINFGARSLDSKQVTGPTVQTQAATP